MPTIPSAPRAVTATLALVAAIAVCALAPGSWLGSLTMLGAGGAGRGCASAAGAHAGLVVDFGTVSTVAGAPSPAVQATCLALSGSNELGSQLLAAAGHTMRWQGGLLCAIDGYPATGCGVGTPKGYQYWSYWHGGSSWAYSSVGPSSYRLSDGAVDGWRFVEGADSGSEGTPRSAASGPCPPAPVVTTPSRPGPTTPVTTVTQPGAGRSTTTVGSSAAPSSTVSTASTPDRPAGAGDLSTTTTEPSKRSIALGAVGSHRPPGNSPAGALGAAGAIVALGLSALLISRHRSLG